ncbi:nucleotidyl transferase AbiEii/AbiGii toxin family protein [Agrobacterium sp. SHOUNA12C]|nr:nucleotidyl transferase AbiEii/AbiGii toxin family protein [Agrobacterium sp. BETTINA12B]MCJ9757029.1 nucleotidyl transferase AbiEii/AbiGii toxin family protein [Agrobacterium sp. SHOUNA12C]
MANDATFDIGKRTMDRIKSASSVHEIDTRKSTERWLCEELSRGFTAVHPVPHIIKGGLLHAQITRETGDLDITFARKMSEGEILTALRQMKPLLAAKGIGDVEIGKMQPLVISGDGGMRFPIVANAGGTRINTHIDITGGRRHLPARRLNESGTPIQVQRTFGSVFFKDQVPLQAYYQPFEGQAADKLSVLLLRPDTTRWKDFTDLSMLQKMGLAPNKIAAELQHKLSFMLEDGEDLLWSLPEVPSTMTWDYAREKAMHFSSWQQKQAKTGSRPKTVDFEDAVCDVRQMYFAVRKAIIESYTPQVAAPVPTVADQARKMREVRKRYQKPEPKEEGNVIQMGRYRDPGSLTFRPKF